jgi:hypothetical protein
MERYNYRPLLPAKHSIRLVQIQPGLPGTEVHCRMIDYTIRDDRVSGVFEALSYVWGETTDPKKVFVTDIHSTDQPDAPQQYLDITSNLYHALQELRDPTLPRIMWIDAVCINQSDLEERSSQVDFMAKIYSYANQVVIWLGPGDNTETKELFAAIEDAADIVHQATNAEQYPKSVPYGSGENNESGRGDDFLEVALENLLARPWFSRMWVLQEAAAARSILVKCGVFELPGSMFTNGVQFLQTDSIYRKKGTRSPSASALETMIRYTSGVDRPFSPHLSDGFREVHARRMPSLGDLIESFYLHGVSDRRDTIFAILNLCSPASRSSIKPDYTKPWSDVWADAIRQILGPGTIVTTPARGEQACLTVLGYVLGTIKLDRYGLWSMKSIYPSGPLAWRALWGSPESWCKNIQNDDVVFFTVGAAAPSIIRTCGDHFDIIVVAAPAPLNTRFDSSRDEGSDFDWHDLLSSLTYSPRRVSLVWDWCTEYPSSCTHHPQLFDGVLVTPGPHPDNMSRMEDSAQIIATLLPSMEISSRTVSTAGQRSLDYMLRQSDNPKFPSVLRTKLQLLRMLLHSGDDKAVYVWLVRQFEILRQIFWIICHHTDSLISCKWIFDYHRSERHPYYNIFDVMSIVGLEVRPQRDGQIVSLHLIDTTDMHNSKYFADLFGNGVQQDYVKSKIRPNKQKRRRGSEGQWTAQHGIRQHLVATVIRHSKFTSADIRISTQSLLLKPLILLRYNSGLRELQASINLRAFALISRCRPDKLDMSWPDQGSDGRHPHFLIMSISLFSQSQTSTKMAYNIMSEIFSLQWVPDDPPIRLHQHIDMSRSDENPGEYRLSRLIPRSSVLTEPGAFPYLIEYNSLIHLFISYHMETLTRYIESTDILEIAAATADDNVLPFLRTLLDLDPDRDHSLQAYREHMLAQFAACKTLPPPSDDEYLLDSSENALDSSGDPTDISEVLMDSDKGSLDEYDDSLDSDEGSLGSGEHPPDGGEAWLESSEDSSVSSEEVWQWDLYDPPP